MYDVRLEPIRTYLYVVDTSTVLVESCLTTGENIIVMKIEELAKRVSYLEGNYG
jgi:hypothetical protein